MTGCAQSRLLESQQQAGVWGWGDPGSFEALSKGWGGRAPASLLDLECSGRVTVRKCPERA